ncbi:MAG: RecX family transcriptional regulator, partial [Candidatus Nanopelagicales bacterium]
RELVQRGVAGEIIDEVLADGVDADSERAAATGLVEKKLRAMGGLDRDTQLRRLVAMLGRKGYSSGMSFSVVQRVLDGQRLTAD